MTDSNRILGRPRAGERISRSDLPLEKDEALPKPPVNQENAQETVPVQASALTWRWATVCPACGFKISGDGTPKRGKRLSRCGGCRRTLYLA